MTLIRPRHAPTYPEWIVALVLMVTVALIWCSAYHRWTARAWTTPLSYSGDSLAAMAGAKAVASGDIPLIMPKYPARFGAPFVGNWNDYPSVEEGVLAWHALFVRIFGLFLGSNLTVLSAQLLAAGSFYSVCRHLRYDQILSFVGSLIFSLSHYAFWRGLAHLTLTAYWHIPLGLLVIRWCISAPASSSKRRFVLSAGVAIAHGVQNPYYSYLFLQFLSLAALHQIVRYRIVRAALLPMVASGALVTTVAVMNIDTVYHCLKQGGTIRTLERNYVGLEVFALKPIELVLPVTHRFLAVERWVKLAYADRTFVRGEMGSAYLGVIGIAAAGLLFWMTFRSVVGSPYRKIPYHLWGVLWIFGFSIIGGLME